ncbi:MAG: endonuclease domain-containing protein [bacterium]
MAKHYYGISKEDYTKALNAQNNRCAICQFKRKLCVDHNHKTGNIRGFLCKHCNSSISLFENKVLFEKTLKYLGVKR